MWDTLGRKADADKQSSRIRDSNPLSLTMRPRQFRTRPSHVSHWSTPNTPKHPGNESIALLKVEPRRSPPVCLELSSLKRPRVRRTHRFKFATCEMWTFDDINKFYKNQISHQWQKRCKLVTFPSISSADTKKDCRRPPRISSSKTHRKIFGNIQIFVRVLSFLSVEWTQPRTDVSPLVWCDNFFLSYSAVIQRERMFFYAYTEKMNSNSHLKITNHKCLHYMPQHKIL